MRYRLDDDRLRKMDRARDVLGIEKERWRADVLDAALNHLLESYENMDEGRSEYDPETIKDLCNTSAFRLYYRTDIESPRNR